MCTLLRWLFSPPSLSRETALRATEVLTAVTALTASVEYSRGGSQVAPGQLNSLEKWRNPRRHWLRPLARAVTSPRAPKVANAARISASVIQILPVERRSRAVAGMTIATATTFIFWAERYGTDGSDEVVLIASSATFVARSSPNPAVADAALWFLAGQSALSYFAAGIAKATSPTWTSGDALGLILRTRSYGHEGVWRWLKAHPRVSSLLTQLVVIAESGVPALLLLRGRAAKSYVLIAGGFHLANGFVMGLGRFFMAFSALYPSVLYVGSVDHRDDRDDRVPRWSLALLAGVVLAGPIDAAIREHRLARDARELSTVQLRDGRRIAYRFESAHHTGPVLVLEAGAAESLSYWDSVARILAKKHPVLSYSRAGYFGSDPAPNRSPDGGLTRQVNDAAELLTNLVFDRPIILVSHSMGSLITRRLAHNTDLLVAGLVFVDGTHPELSDRTSSIHQMTRRTIDLTHWSLRAGFGWMVARRDEYQRAEPAQRSALERQQRTWRVWRTVLDELDGLVVDVELAPYPAPNVPVLTLTAEGTAHSDPPQAQADRDLADAAPPGSMNRVIERSAHLTMILTPGAAERTANQIVEWVGEVVP